MNGTKAKKFNPREWTTNYIRLRTGSEDKETVEELLNLAKNIPGTVQWLTKTKIRKAAKQLFRKEEPLAIS